MDGSLQRYQAFVQTAESGCITRAAERLGYAQSTVSKMIADLESDIGLTLMERSRTGVQLTSDGLALLPHLREVLEAERRLMEEASALQGVLTGQIRIGVFSSVATHWMPRIIQAFEQDHPGIHYELLLGDYREIEQWILEGRVDCGFLRLPTRPDFATISMEQDPLRVILPKGHPLTRKEMVDPRDLSDQPFLLLEHGGKTEVSLLLEEQGVQPDVRFTTWDDYAVMSMVEQGLGIAILPQLILERIPYAVEIRPLSVPAFREIGLALPSRRTASAAVKCFVQYLPCRQKKEEEKDR